MGLPEVARGDVEDPVRQPEGGDGPLGAGQQLGVHGRRLGRCRQGEDLDLVELVDPQQAPRVPAGAAGLPAVTRAVGHQPHRQFRLVQDLVAAQRGQRHLGGGDEPQVVALDVVGVVGELGQLAGRLERLGPHEGRRADLLEGVGVAVEGQLAQAPRQGGAQAAVDREHRPRDASPRSRSKIPRSAPISQCGTRW